MLNLTVVNIYHWMYTFCNRFRASNWLKALIDKRKPSLDVLAIHVLTDNSIPTTVIEGLDLQYLLIIFIFAVSLQRSVYIVN